MEKRYTDQELIEALRSRGGRLWETDTLRRIYIDGDAIWGLLPLSSRTDEQGIVKGYQIGTSIWTIPDYQQLSTALPKVSFYYDCGKSRVFVKKPYPPELASMLYRIGDQITEALPDIIRSHINDQARPPLSMEQVLTALGGRSWKEGGLHRIYFNKVALLNILGIRVTRYSDGVLKTFVVEGQRWDKQRARRFLNLMDSTTVFYDLDSGKWSVSHYSPYPYEEYVGRAVALLKEAAADSIRTGVLPKPAGKGKGGKHEK